MKLIPLILLLLTGCASTDVPTQIEHWSKANYSTVYPYLQTHPAGTNALADQIRAEWKTADDGISNGVATETSLVARAKASTQP